MVINDWKCINHFPYSTCCFSLKQKKKRLSKFKFKVACIMLVEQNLFSSYTLLVKYFPWNFSKKISNTIDTKGVTEVSECGNLGEMTSLEGAQIKSLSHFSFRPWWWVVPFALCSLFFLNWCGLKINFSRENISHLIASLDGLHSCNGQKSLGSKGWMTVCSTFVISRCCSHSFQ